MNVDVLDAAADYLDTFGWFQGDFASSTLASPKCCIVGGLAKIATGNPCGYLDLDMEILEALWEYLGGSLEDDTVLSEDELRENYMEFIATFNDVRGRIKEEVTYALRSCARKLRQEENDNGS